MLAGGLNKTLKGAAVSHQLRLSKGIYGFKKPVNPDTSSRKQKENPQDSMHPWNYTSGSKYEKNSAGSNRESVTESGASSSRNSKGKERARRTTHDSDATDVTDNADDEGAPARDTNGGASRGGGPPDDSDDSDSNDDSDDEGHITRPSFNKDKSVEDTMLEWLALQPSKRKYKAEDVRHNLNGLCRAIMRGALKYTTLWRSGGQIPVVSRNQLDQFEARTYKPDLKIFDWTLPERLLWI
ncbi:hypothetical protein DFH05DRAFT_238993 [Lentinula detonsa]|uniref:Uncharacterized protein n=1 Tax=Lentinula detonsa TaxID=2804962 RepID=A0A9W8NVD2_9AGAR|nr:hypothetical protein DFH05DRAFT_238993 [Lentinula detonsa]